MTEIVPGVHLLPGGPGAFTGVYAPNAYLIAGAEPVLVDSGLADRSLLERWLDYLRGRIKGGLKYILITHGHPDHLGGASFLAGALGGEVAAHWSEEPRLRKALSGAPFRLVTGGDLLPLGDTMIRVIHTPGHCPGHVCYLLPGQRALFSGDHVPGRGTTVVIPPLGDMSDYLNSLRLLMDFDLTTVLPGHGPPIVNPRLKIPELIQHRLEREAQVAALLAQRAMTTGELVREIYPELDSRLEAMARGQLLSHLIKLKREGRAAYHGSRWTAEK